MPSLAPSRQHQASHWQKGPPSHDRRIECFIYVETLSHYLTPTTPPSTTTSNSPSLSCSKRSKYHGKWQITLFRLWVKSMIAITRTPLTIHPVSDSLDIPGSLCAFRSCVIIANRPARMVGHGRFGNYWIISGSGDATGEVRMTAMQRCNNTKSNQRGAVSNNPHPNRPIREISLDQSSCPPTTAEASMHPPHPRSKAYYYYSREVNGRCSKSLAPSTSQAADHQVQSDREGVPTVRIGRMASEGNQSSLYCPAVSHHDHEHAPPTNNVEPESHATQYGWREQFRSIAHQHLITHETWSAAVAEATSTVRY